jgi:hypothetical protein
MFMQYLAKKTEFVGPFRVTPETHESLRKALKYYGVNVSDMANQVINAVIAHAEAKEDLIFPLRFRAVAGPGDPPICSRCGQRLLLGQTVQRGRSASSHSRGHQ